MKEHDRGLRGGPPNKRIAEVRRHLGGFGIRITFQTVGVWRLAWEWAFLTACSSYAPGKRIRWPNPSEIAAQYMVLLLLEMKSYYGLRLPYRAMERIPSAVVQKMEEITARKIAAEARLDAAEGILNPLAAIEDKG